MEGELYNLGGFPGYKRNLMDGHVAVEVYEVTPEILERLDILEGVKWGMYSRIDVDLMGGDKVETYLYNGHVDYLIESGDWLKR